jgi:lipopolysaccharide export LptBFGC system permease protein LptF
MKLLDRYVLTLFLKNYLISLAVLIGIYVVMDMVLRFNDIVAVEKQVGGSGLASVATTLEDVGSYYFYQSFMIFVQMSGIIPVVAAAFTLMRLSRFNELTAFLAAGLPMLRLVLPIVLAAVLLNGLLIVDEELVLPGMIDKLERKHDEMHQAVGKEFPIVAMQVDEHSVLISAMFDPVSNIMRDMDVVERVDRDGALMPSSHLLASRAVWNNGHWDLTDGRIVRNLLPGLLPSSETPIDVYNGNVTPDEIELYRGSSSVEFLPTSKINQLIARPKSYGAAGLYKIKNLRITQPFMNIVLLLLAIPAVLTFDPKTLKTAASKCLTLIGLAMSCVFLCQQMAGKPPLGPIWISLWPALMSWIPIFIFAPIAIWLMDRVKT